ncbi:MAG: hypothetical protein ACOYJR_06655 [Acutalibacteraceae bacterium]
MKEVKIANGWILQKISLRYQYFAFFDTSHYLADSLFVKHQVTVRFLQEYAHDDFNYFIIFAKCRKKDIDKVVTALEELQNKMLICGYLDYQKCCEMFMAKMQKNREDS